MIKVLYAGDYALIHHTYVKGMNSWTVGEAFDEREYFLSRMKQDSELDITYLPTSYISRDFPSTREELEKYQAIIISDVGTDTILLYPDLFKIPMGPNRLSLLSDFVKNGGGLITVGGWMSYGGQMGQAKYHNTILEEMLDIDVSPFDDRIEVPEGFTFKAVKKEHPLVHEMDWEKSPPLFLGYNKFKAKDPEKVVAQYNNDPMIVINSWGEGRTVAFASDLAPHWGQGFIDWNNYAKFWGTCIRWVTSRI